MNERITKLVNRVKKHLIATYGEKIREVILYGSYVRGEATKDSENYNYPFVLNVKKEGVRV